MRARLERHVERRAARRLPRLRERDPLGVRATAGRSRAAADHGAVLDQDRADGRVRRGEAERPLAEVQRGLHPALVVRSLPVRAGALMAPAAPCACAARRARRASGSA